jgi:hypothetical protein
MRTCGIVIVSLMFAGWAQAAPIPTRQPTTGPAPDAAVLLTRIAALEARVARLEDQNRALQATLAARKIPVPGADPNLPTSCPADWVPSFKDADANGDPTSRDLDQIALGKVGRLPTNGLVKVTQVINDHEFRGQLGSQVQTGPPNSLGFSPPTRFVWQPNPVWFQGIETKGMADGTGVTLSQPFIVAGTRRFQTVAGGRTEYLLEPLDEKAWKAAYLIWKQRLSAPAHPGELP